MAAIKEPKKAKAATFGKESDEDFFKRLAKLKEDASKKASKEIGSYSKELEESRAKGRQIGKDLEEIEECNKIVKEFESSPPIMTSVNINGVSFGYSCEDSKVAKKIEQLKKHGFGFHHATNSTSTTTIEFRTFGKAYVKHGSQKITLPESSVPAIVNDSNLGMGGGVALNPKDVDFVLKDGDVLGTEKGGYIYNIKDVKEHSETYSTGVFIFPESELKISIHTETVHPQPAFMDPSQVPDAIKRTSKSTVITDTLLGVELIKGLFQIHFFRQGRDVNGLIGLPSGYPHIEFKPSSELMANIFDEMTAKAGKGNPAMAKILEAVYSKSKAEMRAKSGGKCEDISTFIELTQDGSIVLFNTANVVVHKDIGKEAKKMMFSTANVNLHKDISEGGWPIKKITLTRNALYETDCTTNPDPRVAAAVKISMGLGGYVSALATKKEQKGEPFSYYTPMTGDEVYKKMREEDLKSLKLAEDLGAVNAVEMLKEKMKSDEKSFVKNYNAEQKEMMDGIENAKKMLEYVEKDMEKFKRQIESVESAGLPPYNPP